ncbi:hypothetical protein ACIBK9_01220 [Nonomuraea sp. NPDC050227]|uniref:hypothetical protein n=1 Tax=Nonomuraea sp. NPDC050227 TaxID=3364360 RepID=UPI00378FE2E4
MHPEEQAHELASRVHVALRDGGLDARTVLELASLLEEWGLSTATTRELLESSAARLNGADLAHLGEGLLNDIDFRPGFTLDPQLWATLEQALKIVERDVRAGGITGPLRLITDPSRGRHDAQVEFEGSYHGNGIPPEAGSDAQTALLSLAEAVQETVMELTWTVWPVCPVHDRGLHVGGPDRGPVWWCAVDGGHVVALVGELS